MPEVSSMIAEMDDDLEFAMDVMEPLCKEAKMITTNKNELHIELLMFFWISQNIHKRYYKILQYAGK